MTSPHQKKIVPFRPHPFPPRKFHKNPLSKLVNRANRYLEKYNDVILNSPSLELFLAQLVHLEAIASVESQKVKATLKEFLLFLHSKGKKNSKLALVDDYRKALLWACKRVKKHPLSKEMLCKIHKMAKKSTRYKKELGFYREQQNWIGPDGCKIEEAYFYPPAAKNVEKLMRQLLRYSKKKEGEPLLQLALLLAQFLIIHPFMDGNGRISRMLIPLFLYREKAIPLPFFFMSNFLLKHRLHYFQNLFTTTRLNRWEPWAAFFLKGVLQETRNSLRLFKQLLVLENKMKQKIPSMQKETLHFLFNNPVFSRSSFKGNGNVLKALQKAKLVQKDSNKIYCFSSLLKILKK
jgi:Fic family protein